MRGVISPIPAHFSPRSPAGRFSTLVQLPQFPPISPVTSAPFSVTSSGPRTPLSKSSVGSEAASIASLDWDTFTEQPEFQLSITSSEVGTHATCETTFTTVGGVRKIPIVSTDYSDLESINDSSEDVFRPNLNNRLAVVDEEQPKNMTDSSSEGFSTADMAKQVSTALEKCYQGIIDEITDLPANNIEAGLESQAEKDRDDIWKRKNEFRDQVRSFISEYGSSCPNLKTLWEEKLSHLVEIVIQYRNDVTKKIEQLRPTVRMTEFEKQSIELQKQALAEKKEKREEKEKAEKEEGLAKAKKELLAFRSDYEYLLQEINYDETPYSERDDVSIATAMYGLKSWKDTFTRISKSYREYESLATVYGEQDTLEDIDDAQTERVVAAEMFEKIKNKFETTKKEIEKMDTERGLYSNHKPMGEKLEYPKFSGAAGEDYIKFYDKMVKALRHNKVAKADQVERLRKTLSGFALGLVPESTESIDKAFATLKAAFGDPRKVLDERMKKLRHVGDLPSEKLNNSKNGFRKQEEWYLNVEGLLYDIIELGKRDDDLAYEVFSSSTFNFILSLFPIKLAEQLEEVEGTRREKLTKVLEKLAAFREKVHRLGRIYGDKVPPGVSDSGSSGSKPVDRPTSRVAANPGSVFKEAKRNTDCRICGQLETEGVTDKLYEDHLSTYPTGCPKFIAMKMVRRKDVAIKAKLCLWCLDPDVVYDSSHRDSCRVKGGKIKRYTCEASNCKNTCGFAVSISRLIQHSLRSIRRT